MCHALGGGGFRTYRIVNHVIVIGRIFRRALMSCVVSCVMRRAPSPGATHDN